MRRQPSLRADINAVKAALRLAELWNSVHQSVWQHPDERWAPEWGSDNGRNNANKVRLRPRFLNPRDPRTLIAQLRRDLFVQRGSRLGRIFRPGRHKTAQQRRWETGAGLPKPGESLVTVRFWHYRFRR